ncbi:hypothetical protein [Candidatus Halocynthiibacter alkanivorans]|jgi:hypothetical protein|uniref:hypothetical protein n=1 Tax=Candidatus Halocynthiibacter alkanivorans TaxID=2267619 RepID=UPI000DF2AD5B|nr:hypothetical protein [Candidatus Halocynthiibacter alkanivorans]
MSDHTPEELADATAILKPHLNGILFGDGTVGVGYNPRSEEGGFVVLLTLDAAIPGMIENQHYMRSISLTQELDKIRQGAAEFADSIPGINVSIDDALIGGAAYWTAACSSTRPSLPALYAPTHR